MFQEIANRMYDVMASLRRAGSNREFMDALNRLEKFEKENGVIAYENQGAHK